MLLLAVAAGAVVTGAPRGHAAPTGVIEGKVVNATTGRPQPGVELTLTTGTEEGDNGKVAVARSDRRGRYRFVGLATGEDRFYALDARFEGGLFAGRPVSLPSDTSTRPVITSTMRVWPTTTDPAVIRIRRDNLFVVPSETGVGVIESVTVVNGSDRAYIGRGAGLIGDAASGATVAFALPSGATGINVFESDLDIPDLVDVDQGFAATIAFPPGDTRTTFSYVLSGEGGSFDLSRPVLYDTDELSIFAAAPLEVRSNRLHAGEAVTLEGKTYERWSTNDPIAAGDPLQAIAVANADMSVGPLLASLGGLVVLVGAGAWLFGRRRRPREVPVDPPSRERLLEEVAALDIAFESGDLDERAWHTRRAPLVDRLRSLETLRS
ncbi:MAG TPA: carboxypeptidase-like regulatory domain-containing protein [Actinomycetota bacterium]|nr:carboxypeptidase-like regulatory domain-containing protein [Actinomycetota bacterium]